MLHCRSIGRLWIFDSTVRPLNSLPIIDENPSIKHRNFGPERIYFPFIIVGFGCSKEVKSP